ncbi:hypothetical protein M8C21_003288, partial [Ambrosia artemisiifolia]
TERISKKEYYEFAARNRLDIQLNKTRGVVDYIGILQDTWHGTTNDQKPYIIMTIIDCSNQPITVALWSHIINSPIRYNKKQIESAQEPVIVGFPALRGKTFVINGHISEVHAHKEWYYKACPACHQCWYCTRDGNLQKPSNMFRLSATITDGTGSIQATVFDKVARHLLSKTCDGLLAMSNPIDAFLKIEN